MGAAFDDWRAQAKCLGEDPELFFPISDNETAKIARAKRVCGGCPVRERCLASAAPVGIWGALTETERKDRVSAARRGRQERSCIRCGGLIPKEEPRATAQYSRRQICSPTCGGSTRGRRILEYEELLDLGLTADEIARAFGITRATIERTCYRAKRPDLVRRMTGTVRSGAA